MIRLLILTGLLLLLLAACSEESPPQPEPKPQAEASPVVESESESDSDSELESESNSESESESNSDSESASQARVIATGTGLFKVEPDVLTSLGWNAESPLTLVMNGQTMAYERHDGALYFYLPESTPGRYSNQHALWLHHDKNRAAEENALPSNTPLTTVIAEQRLTGYEKYNSIYVGDPWFWRTLVAAANETHEVPTPGRQDGAVEVTVRVGGSTKVKHQVKVTVNDQEAGVLEWSGQVRHEERFTVQLPAGEQIAVTFEVPKSEGGGFDISLLDDVIVHYPSQPLATEGIFKGMSESEGVAKFDQGDFIAWQIEPEVKLLPSGAEGLFLPANQAVVVTERGIAQPTSVESVENTNISTDGAEYVAIVVPELRDAIQPLLDFHREQGLTVLALSPQQVYDAYTAGTVDPLALRGVLADGLANWSIKPRFMLLVGDSTYDPGGYQNELPATYLPSPFINTVFGGETVSDNIIADTDEDGYPNVALGRLPAQSDGQLTTMIEKIIAYSKQPAEGEWQQRILFTADGREQVFKNTSAQLSAELPAEIESVQIYPEAASDAASQMIPALNEGHLIVNYIGHGSVQQWGRDQLLTVDVASELSNGQRLPIFINMTCLTGLFSHPSEESLAETLLWAQNGGAIAAIAPSSLTLPNNQKPLNAALLKELLSPEGATIGEALMRAKQTVPLGNNNQQDIVATFNLLGDPALFVLQ